MVTTTFTQAFGIRHPIIQAGMGNDCGWQLASEVSNAGALGTIGSIGRTPDDLREQIGRCRRETSEPFAVNVVAFEWAPFWRELLDVAIVEQVPAVAVSFGDVLPAIQRCRAAGIRVMVQVQTMAAARAALAERPDLLIAQGHEAGGHTGVRGTLSFAAQVLEIAEGTPVAVAGGIGNGRGLAAVLAMGAAAAVMGTRFKASAEFGPLGSFDAEQKAALVASDGDNTVHADITDIAMGMTWPTGIAGRVIRNRFTEEWQGRDDELRAAVAAIPEPFGWTGRNNQSEDTLLNWAGESAGLVDTVRPAAEIVTRTVAEAESLLRESAKLLG